MIMRNRIIIVALLVLFGYKLSAQTIITGIVSDSVNIPVPNAAVYISKTTIGTFTDQKGAYSISIPQQGEFELTASFIGYKTKSVIIFANGNRQIINIKLSLNPVLLNEVTVRSKNKYSLFLDLTVTSFSKTGLRDSLILIICLLPLAKI